MGRLLALSKPERGLIVLGEDGGREGGREGGDGFGLGSYVCSFFFPPSLPPSLPPSIPSRYNDACFSTLWCECLAQLPLATKMEMVKNMEQVVTVATRSTMWTDPEFHGTRSPGGALDAFAKAICARSAARALRTGRIFAGMTKMEAMTWMHGTFFNLSILPPSLPPSFPPSFPPSLWTNKSAAQPQPPFNQQFLLERSSVCLAFY